ncbi:MAG: A/G-specific adenine glycosylase [Bilophila sp.]
MNEDTRFSLLQTSLLGWFAVHRRPLPWRTDYTPYRTWIAEVMLQQTQMERGVQYFLRWMERFPDIASVADAPEEALLKAWEGLGYYRRVRNIQAAAQKIMTLHRGIFPTDHAAILALPGIGPYTAGAIASTAFNEDVPCVDGNVERVFSRVFDITTPVKEEPAKSRILTLAQGLIPPGHARDFNQGLMELGALLCRKVPDCTPCPLQELCEAYQHKTVSERPVPGRKAVITKLEVASGILLLNGRVFTQRRRDNDVWGGLWEFPGGCVEAGESPEQAVAREWMEELGFVVEAYKPLVRIRHSYTTYRITLHSFLLRLVSGAPENALVQDGFPVPPVLTAATAFRWLPIEQIHDIPLPAPHRKLVDTCTLFDKNQLTDY